MPVPSASPVQPSSAAPSTAPTAARPAAASRSAALLSAVAGFSETDSLRVVAWPDPVIDSLGHDARSIYVETFWLGILGPSTTFLLRLLANGLERSADGFDLPLAETARCLGLGDKGGRTSPFARSLSRLVQFEVAQWQGDALAVRLRIPPLNRRQVLRLPEGLQAAHERWQAHEAATPQVEALRRRGRQLALSLLELGEERDAAERQLLRWRYHPAMAADSVAWAWDRHEAARQAAAAVAPVTPIGSARTATGPDAAPGKPRIGDRRPAPVAAAPAAPRSGAPGDDAA